MGTGAAGRRRINKLGQSGSLIVEADEAMARGDVRQAASLLEAAAQRGGDASTLLRLATVRRALGDFPGAVAAAAAAVELTPRNFLMALLLGQPRRISMGAVHGAQRAYRVALDHAPVDPSFQPAIIKQLQHAKLLVEAAENWRNRLLSGSRPTPPFHSTRPKTGACAVSAPTFWRITIPARLSPPLS